jgi:hypothetical protein
MQFVRQTQTQTSKKIQVFYFSLLYLYIEALKSVKTKSLNLMGKVKRGWDHVRDRSETINEFTPHAGSCPYLLLFFFEQGSCP